MRINNRLIKTVLNIIILVKVFILREKVQDLIWGSGTHFTSLLHIDKKNYTNEQSLWEKMWERRSRAPLEKHWV